MNTESGDYIVFSEGKSAKGKARYGLMKVTGFEGKKLHGYLAKNSHIKALRAKVEVSKKDVVLNLGQQPAPGSVYGQDVTKIYRSRIVHDDFGALYFFTDLDSEVQQTLLDSFTRVYKSLKQQGLDFLVDASTTIWEVLPYNGEKYAGMYKQSRKPDEVPNVAQIRPDICGVNTEGGGPGMRYVIFHELAHHVDFNYLHRSTDARKLRAQWVKLYKSSIAPESLSKEQCKDLRDKLFDQEDMPTDFMGQLEEDDKHNFKLILGWFRQVYSLSPQELNLLWDGDARDEIKDIWPMRISKKALAPVISEYATTKVAETFAEAVSFYWCKKPLPKNVVKLVEKTLSFVKTQREG